MADQQPEYTTAENISWAIQCSAWKLYETIKCEMFMHVSVVLSAIAYSGGLNEVVAKATKFEIAALVGVLIAIRVMFMVQHLVRMVESTTHSVRHTQDKVNFIEKRNMFQNFLPHELRRQVVQVICEWNEGMDPTWIERQLRTLLSTMKCACMSRRIQWGTEHASWVLAEARLEIVNSPENHFMADSGLANPQALRLRALGRNIGQMRCTEPNESLEDAIARLREHIGEFPQPQA